jgi:DNA repair protein RecO (recombination protein O)
MMSVPCEVLVTAKINMRGAYHPAYLLHSRPFQDDKLLLDLLLQDGGRVRAVARRPSKKKGGRSQWPLFTLCQIQLGGRGELKTVLAIEESTVMVQLQAEFLFSAFYLNELICRIWPVDAHSDGLFGLYQQSLHNLARYQGDPPMLQPILRQFEFAILAELGIAVDFSADAFDVPLSAETYYHWHAEQGFVPAVQGFLGADLQAVAAGSWTLASLRCAKQLTRTLLKPLLGTQPLKSRALFADVTSESGGHLT